MTLTTTRIEPYKRASKSAHALSLHTGVLRATPKQVQKHGTFDNIINWGNSERRFENANYINDPEAVTIASSKLLTARRLGEARVAQPEWTTDKSVAEGWFNDGNDVLCRTLLRASGGKGITLAGVSENDGATAAAGDEWRTNDGGVTGNTSVGDNGRAANTNRRGNVVRRTELVNAPMYTKYVKKADEYRVHVFDGEVIDIQQKRRRQELSRHEVDFQIRNTDSGWVFCRDDVDCPDGVRSTAVSAVSALRLDFGAVDIGYNRHQGAATVYEVNTAPGLEGTTLEKYRAALIMRLPFLTGGSYNRRRTQA